MWKPAKTQTPSMSDQRLQRSMRWLYAAVSSWCLLCPCCELPYPTTAATPAHDGSHLCTPPHLYNIRCLPIFKILSMADSLVNFPLLNILPHLNCVATLPCKISMFKYCHAQWLCAANWGVKTQLLKKIAEKYFSLIFVDTKVKNNLCRNITKAKSLFIVGKLSSQFFIFKQDHCKANKAHRAINLFACNFAKHSSILKFLSLPNLAINRLLSDRWIAHHTLNAQLHYLVIYHSQYMFQIVAIIRP